MHSAPAALVLTRPTNKVVEEDGFFIHDPSNEGVRPTPARLCEKLQDKPYDSIFVISLLTRIADASFARCKPRDSPDVSANVGRVYCPRQSCVRFIDAFVDQLDLRALLGFPHASGLSSEAAVYNEQGRETDYALSKGRLTRRDGATSQGQSADDEVQTTTCEHPWAGTIKRAMNSEYRLMRRRLQKARRNEPTVLAYNIKLMLNLLGVPQMIAAVAWCHFLFLFQFSARKSFCLRMHRCTKRR